MDPPGNEDNKPRAVNKKVFKDTYVTLPAPDPGGNFVDIKAITKDTTP